ncbi:hypothetical protein DICSQDRAFT_124968 [Dichomitus squalens LYAD-421 SS1]|uniref:uncharacterized protein n=1 Tax=Dichomitus squalens (strain LYAD-421) TaxID=732165 RepID=UPI0004414767|nr:uncharacterized protein DICSQDRAFT_124968 [Dichomitus squalens LYAD-421 SS1]EJF64814.1 hypothetical protein DICSQDRAFT_124968 [Dichomitus squalens LYAD-421 SS1]
MSRRVVALDHLPVELLYDIHAFASSPALPLTCKYLYEVFKSAPATVHADYLISCYENLAAQSASVRAFGFVSRILRYPICTQEVLEAIFRNPSCPLASSTHSTQRTVTVLPRRLFRNLAPRDDPGQRPWTDDDEPLPFLRYLYGHERISVIATNSYDGYALTRAVYAEFTPLVRFLLANEASPECKDNLAVAVAIRRRSLPLVRMLIERDGPGDVAGDSNTIAQTVKRTGGGGSGRDVVVIGKKRSSSSDIAPRSAKKRKLGDRVTVNQEMLKTAVKCDARDIVEYLMREKGCVPNMQTVLLMGQ